MFESLKKAVGIKGATVGASAGSAAVNRILPAAGLRPCRRLLPYHLSTVRWHLDIRPHASVVLLHDLGSSAASWSGVNKELSKLPLSELTPTMPLHVYMPDLRNHGRGEHVAGSTVSDYVQDVVAFSQQVVEPQSPLHIVGIGFGARLALLASLTIPARVASVTAIVSSDPFSPVSAPCERLQLLAQACAEGATTLKEIDERLAATVPNDLERKVLLLSLIEHRAPEKKVVLQPNITDICNMFAEGAPSSAWPTLALPDGSDANPAAVAGELAKQTAHMQCSVLRGTTGVTAGMARPVDTARLSSYFPTNNVVDLPTTFALGAIRPVDEKLIVQTVLNNIHLLTAVPDPEDEADNAAQEQG